MKQNAFKHKFLIKLKTLKFHNYDSRWKVLINSQEARVLFYYFRIITTIF